MSEAETIERDLLGDPVTLVKNRWGRPTFAKTKENQRVVSMLVARGWTQLRIARYIGCDEKTLRKHFSRELDEGRDLIEGLAMEILVNKMVGGDRQSVNKVLELIDKGKAAVLPKEPKAPKLGKKEQAKLDAAKGHENSSWGQLLQ